MCFSCWWIANTFAIRVGENNEKVRCQKLLCSLPTVACPPGQKLPPGLRESHWYYWQLRHFGQLFFHLMIYYLGNFSYEARSFFISGLKIYSKAAYLACIHKYTAQEFGDQAKLSLHLRDMGRDRRSQIFYNSHRRTQHNH